MKHIKTFENFNHNDKLNEELSLKGILPLLTSLMVSFNSPAFTGHSHHSHHSHSSHSSHSHAYSHALRTSMPWIHSSAPHTNEPEPAPLQNNGEEVNSGIEKLRTELSLLRSYLKSNILSDITSTLDTIRSMDPNNLTEERINEMCDRLDSLISMYKVQDSELTNGISSVRNRDYEELYKNYQNSLAKYNEKLDTLKQQPEGSKENLIVTIIFATGVAFLLIILIRNL